MYVTGFDWTLLLSLISLKENNKQKKYCFWIRSRPNHVGVGSGPSDFRSRSRPIKWRRLRNTSRTVLKIRRYGICSTVIKINYLSYREEESCGEREPCTCQHLGQQSAIFIYICICASVFNSFTSFMELNKNCRQKLKNNIV